MPVRPQCSPNIEDCMKEFLLSLAVPELTAFRAMIASIITVATLLKNLAIAQLDELNVVKTVYNALMAPVLAAQAALVGGLGMLPLDKINQFTTCIGLGTFVGNIRDLIKNLNPRLALMEDLINEIDIAIDRLRARITQITDYILMANSVVACIDQVVLYLDQGGQP